MQWRAWAGDTKSTTLVLRRWRPNEIRDSDRIHSGAPPQWTHGQPPYRCLLGCSRSHQLAESAPRHLSYTGRVTGKIRIGYPVRPGIGRLRNFSRTTKFFELLSIAIHWDLPQYKIHWIHRHYGSQNWCGEQVLPTAAQVIIGHLTLQSLKGSCAVPTVDQARKWMHEFSKEHKRTEDHIPAVEAELAEPGRNTDDEWNSAVDPTMSGLWRPGVTSPDGSCLWTRTKEDIACTSQFW